MFNIGSGELVVIAVVALLVLGPKRLPELARGLGKFMREFRRQTDEVRGVVEREFYAMDREGPDGKPLPPSQPAPVIRPPEGGAVARGSPLDPELPVRPVEGWQQSLDAAHDKAEPPGSVFSRPLASVPPPDSAKPLEGAAAPVTPAAPPSPAAHSSPPSSDVAEPSKPK